LDFNWSRRLLWDLEIPVEHMRVAVLRWVLSMPVGTFECEHFPVSPAQVRQDPERHKNHYIQAHTSPQPRDGTRTKEIRALRWTDVDLDGDPNGNPPNPAHRRVAVGTRARRH
jgi:hypothetical protein